MMSVGVLVVWVVPLPPFRPCPLTLALSPGGERGAPPLPLPCFLTVGAFNRLSWVFVRRCEGDFPSIPPACPHPPVHLWVAVYTFGLLRGAAL